MKRIYRRRSSHETAINQKGNKQEQAFFNTSAGETFFQPAIQRKCEKCDEEDKKVHKKDAETINGLNPISASVEGWFTPNKVNFANCANINVRGRTTANYSNSYSMNGTPQRAQDCTGCSGDQCISFSGNLISVFRANPRVTLPSVPAGLNACEQAAVANFIATTITQHEQEHVNAFNTYIGTITTPVSFTGCRTALDRHVKTIHNGLEASRRTSANQLSDALDANGANNFTVTCDCPDPEPPASTEGKK